MTVETKPSFEVVVSPALTMLRHAAMHAFNTSELPDEEEAVAEDVPAQELVKQAEPQDVEPSAEQSSAPSRLPFVFLQRDGLRPIKLRGQLLLEAVSKHGDDSSEDKSVTRKLRLFSSEDGGVAASVQLEPGPACPARPVSQAAMLGSASDLDCLLSETAARFPSSTPPSKAQEMLRLSEMMLACAPRFTVSAGQDA